MTEQSGKPARTTLSEQVAELISAAILKQEYLPGAPIPTEPELAEKYGVSRAVIRDSARILMARGLIDIRHGKGMFVTEPENTAFSEALYLAVKRAGARVWDVEELEQILLPEVVALAAVNASEEELKNLSRLSGEYMDAFKASLETPGIFGNEEQTRETLLSRYREFIKYLFRVSGNKLLFLLAEPLTALRGMHIWDGGDEEPAAKEAAELERLWHDSILKALATRNAKKAAEIIRLEIGLPKKAVQTLKNTPFGKTPVIPLGIRALRKLKKP